MKRTLLAGLLLLLTTLPGVANPGQSVVQIAQRQLGVPCQNVSLVGYRVDGRHTNGCATLVSAVESAAGRYRQVPGDPWVERLEKALLAQGWKPIRRADTRPGDVAIFHDASGEDQHTEIVASNGATRLIGNNGDAQEVVSYDSGHWGNPTFYTKDDGLNPRQVEARLRVAEDRLAALESQLSHGQDLVRLAPQVGQLYADGAISQVEAHSITNASRRSKALSQTVSKVRLQVAAATHDLRQIAPSRVAMVTQAHPTTLPGDAAAWQNLYDEGAISHDMLQRHLQP